MATKLIERLAGAVQTTDATPTDILTWPMPDASAALVLVRIVARRPSNGNSAAYLITGGYKRHAGGNATMLGAGTVTLATPEDDATWAVVLNNLTTSIRVQVTGAAAATIEWFADAEITLYTP